MNSLSTDQLRKIATQLESIGHARNVTDAIRLAAIELDNLRRRLVGDGLFSIGTWDGEKQGYTSQGGCQTPWMNVNKAGLRAHLKELKTMGYSCHRKRDESGEHDANDWTVLVERTDGASEAEILKSWER